MWGSEVLGRVTPNAPLRPSALSFTKLAYCRG